MSNKEKNYYWIIGDRFACVERSKSIIKKINESNNFDIKKIKNTSDADIFCENIRSQNLFGPKGTIYIYEGKLPHTKKVINCIKKCPKNKIIIHIEDKSPNKNTKFYKTFKDNIIEYATTGKKIFLPKSVKSEIKNIVKKISNWEGDEKIFNKIFEYSGFDYGCAINEIEKIRIYLKSEKINNFEEIEDIIYKERDHDFTVLVDLIKKKKRKEAVELVEYLSETKYLKNNSVLILGQLHEIYTFLFYGCVAKESGHTTQDGICDYIYENYNYKDANKDKTKINNRLYYHLDIIKNNNSQYFLRCIKNTEIAHQECMAGIFSEKFIFSKLICKI